MRLECQSALFVFAWLSRLVLTETQKGLHPFLYFNEEDIGDLQHRAGTTHSIITASIRTVVETMKRTPKQYLPPKRWEEYASHWNEQFGNNLCVLAFYCVLYENDTQARELAISFMETLSSHPNWRVKASLRDDVPVAHSLNGMATAFDVLYSVLNDTQRQRFLSKIAAVTEEMYGRSKDSHVWWSKAYIQNHVATNFMALLTGALVVSRHNKSNAEPWIAHAQRMLGRNMEILNGVIDGSMNEGAAYGSYTSRSLTQFVFLALRHLHVDFTLNAWLREHFWFVYRTMLPGVFESVGIADSNRNWFYGPESQLVFLDNFVLKNGYGNWLASQIRKHRLNNSSRLSSQRNCMLHTEFLFYNASIPERAPPADNKPHLHVFSDWGVVTYGGGMQSTRTRSEHVQSFLSFKCGVLHGRVVNTLVRNGRVNSPSVKSWKHFNPGHEHPDQGSFVFAPNGVPFITDTLYGPKYTWLNNALVFGPSDTSPCLGPDEGQIGGCGQWFDYRKAASWEAEGEILGWSSEGSMVYMSGEMSKWYRPSLGLRSVYRSLVLLTPSVLLVVDSIERAWNSSASYMRAFFHNIDKPFTLERHASGFPAAKATLEGGDHMVLWLNGDVSGSGVHIGTKMFRSGGKVRETHYVNVTIPLTNLHTRAAYLFVGPGNNIGPAHMVNVDDRGVRVTVSLNGVSHTVSIATKPFQPYARYEFLGFGGFAKVQISDKKTVRFGLDLLVSPRRAASPTKTVQVEANIISPSLLSVVVLCVLMFLFLQLGRRIPLRTFWRVAFVVVGLLWCAVSLATYKYFCSQGGCVWKHVVVIMKPPASVSLVELPVPPPFVVYTSLPLAGAELGKYLFQNNTDFLHVNLNASYLDKTSNKPALDHFNLDPCTLYERYYPDHKYAPVSKWLRQLLKKGPILSYKSQGALPVVRLEDPGWSLKLPWLRKVLYSRMRAFVIVRDPRAWVHAWVTELRNSSKLRQGLYLFTDERSWRCPDVKVSLLEPEYRDMLSVLRKSNQDTERKLHTILAHLWMTHMNAALRLTKNVPPKQLLFLRFEDLVTQPKSAARRLYRFLGLSLPPAVEHKILQMCLTGTFSLGNSREKIDARTATSWKMMKSENIREINEICSPVMRKLDYKV